LPHPAKVRVKAKSVIADNEMTLFPILRFTSFPVTRLNYVLVSFVISHMFSALSRANNELIHTFHGFYRLSYCGKIFPTQCSDNRRSEGSPPAEKRRPPALPRCSSAPRRTPWNAGETRVLSAAPAGIQISRARPHAKRP
jgi:hypothetical protein